MSGFVFQVTGLKMSPEFVVEENGFGRYTYTGRKSSGVWGIGENQQ